MENKQDTFMPFQEPRIPSGGEVESATIRREAAMHPPVIPVDVPFAGSHFGQPQSGWKSRLGRAVGMIRSKLPHRRLSFPPGAKATMKQRMSTAVSSARESLRAKPARYAGIASGVGFGLGLLGRTLTQRLRNRSLQPRVLVIREYC
jgi:ElaB/YqjD/DUF883 family membrane-anchored ribosome-binding protein